MNVVRIQAGGAATTRCLEPLYECFEAIIPAPAHVSVFDGFTPVDGPLKAALSLDRTDLGDEGYQLTCDKNGYHLIANTDAGIFHGRQTLRQLQTFAPVPCCEILDKPAMTMRAVMFDLARCKERHEYYYAMVDRLSQWKINTIFLHLTDHTGCALQFERYPGLSTKYAFSQEEMADLIRYAAERHIELVPEIEAWGHARYITRLDEFADLAEDRDDPRALCTMNPATWELLGNMLDETAALFPSKYIHVGCDEAPFGRCQICLDYAERNTMDALAGEHVKRVCELALERGKTPMIWGDVLLQHRGSTELIPKDAVICDWHYDAEVSPESVEFFRSQGFQVLCCPAIVWGSRMILPRLDTLDNVHSFAGVSLEAKCLGLKTTAWIPQRYISDTLLFGLAYTAELAWGGDTRSRERFARAFARTYFGLDPQEDLVHSLIDVHQLSDKSFARVTDLWEHTEELLKLSTDELRQAEMPGLELARAVSDTINRCRQDVRSNAAEYDALALAAVLGCHVKERNKAIHSLICDLRRAEALCSNGGADQSLEHVDGAIESLRRLVDAESTIRQKMEQAWDRWRYADDPIKTSKGENLMGAVYGSEQFVNTVLHRVEDIRSQLSVGEQVDWQSVFRKPEDSA